MTNTNTEETMTTEATVEERIQGLASGVVAHEAEAAKHKAEADKLKFELRQLLDFGTHPAGNLKVTISKPSRSFDLDAFLKAYPVELNPALYKYAVNSEAMPPALKNQFMTPGTGDPKVSVK